MALPNMRKWNWDAFLLIHISITVVNFNCIGSSIYIFSQIIPCILHKIYFIFCHLLVKNHLTFLAFPPYSFYLTRPLYLYIINCGHTGRTSFSQVECTSMLSLSHKRTKEWEYTMLLSPESDWLITYILYAAVGFVHH